jgi:acyl-CoA thioester hydrolase
MAEPFSHQLRVRYAECDALGVVFNAHYLTYVDQTMTELFRVALGGYGSLLESGLDMVVAEVGLRFRAPARFDEVLDLQAVVAHIGTTSLITNHRILCDGGLLLEGEIRHVWVQSASTDKARIPDWVRSGLAPFTTAPPF